MYHHEFIVMHLTVSLMMIRGLNNSTLFSLYALGCQYPQFSREACFFTFYIYVIRLK